MDASVASDPTSLLGLAAREIKTLLQRNFSSRALSFGCEAGQAVAVAREAAEESPGSAEQGAG